MTLQQPNSTPTPTPTPILKARSWKDARGRTWSALEGDFDSIPEHDRPPRFICENVAAGHRLHYDDSPDRPGIPQRYPGRPIVELQGRHTGAVAILHNGPSLSLCDLDAINIPLLGMNRTFVGHEGYTGPQPDYYCFSDHPWANHLERAGYTRENLFMRSVVDGSSLERSIGAYRATKSQRMFPFSFDLARDGYVPPVPCTTSFLALQLAAYLGFTTFYCLGLDLGGGHFDGTPASKSMPAALENYGRVAQVLEAAGISAYTVEAPDSPAPFPHISFAAMQSLLAAQ